VSAELGGATKLLGCYAELGPTAREILVEIAERLVVGKAHGDFESALNWQREGDAELLDAVVYALCERRRLRALAVADAPAPAAPAFVPGDCVTVWGPDEDGDVFGSSPGALSGTVEVDLMREPAKPDSVRVRFPWAVESLRGPYAGREYECAWFPPSSLRFLRPAGGVLR